MVNQVELEQQTKPVVMVWVGADEINRGDTQGMIGLARHCSRLVDGRYVYMDNAKLDKMFPKVDKYKDKIRAALKVYGQPDILFGGYAADVYFCMDEKPKLFINDINEDISLLRNFDRFVAHDITFNKLRFSRAEFKAHYPDIKGPLFAVFIGGSSFSMQDEGRDLAKKLYYLAAQHDESTIFVCPSRRSGKDYDRLMEHLNTGFHSWFDEGSLKVNFKKAIGRAPKVNIIGQSYKDILNGYNPYVGLLGAADHIFVLGDSYSIACETMATGKPVYADFMYRYYDDCVDRGQIVPLHTVEIGKLPKARVKPINYTRDLALRLVDEYQRACLRRSKESAVSAVIKLESRPLNLK